MVFSQETMECFDNFIVELVFKIITHFLQFKFAHPNNFNKIIDIHIFPYDIFYQSVSQLKK
jgi:hypothetical protein